MQKSIDNSLFIFIFQKGQVVHKQTGLCLSLQTDTYRVALEECSYQRSQVWQWRSVKKQHA